MGKFGDQTKTENKLVNKMKLHKYVSGTHRSRIQEVKQFSDFLFLIVYYMYIVKCILS